MALQRYFNKRTITLLGVLAFISFIPVSQAESVDYREYDIESLQALMHTGKLSSRHLVEFYLARIDAVDRNGPIQSLRSIRRLSVLPLHLMQKE